MAIECGFYNAINHDRTYDAVQMSSIFDGIIEDGIFQNIGNHLAVTADGTNMYVSVGSGRAWFNHTWTNNDTEYPIEVEQSEVVLSRIDSVVLEVNSEESVRNNTIKILKGTPSSTPVAPELTNTTAVHQYRLANILVEANVTTISQGNITNFIGTSETPFITGLLETIDADSLLAQWNAQFDEWFEHLHNELDENQAANLQNQIDAIQDMFEMNEFTIEIADWVSNLASPDYPYAATVESDLYTDDFEPIGVDMLPTNGTVFFSEDEIEAQGLLNKQIMFNSEGFIVYASDVPACPIKFRVCGKG